MNRPCGVPSRTNRTLVRARLHSGLGVMVWKDGDYAAARIHHTQSLEMCRQVGEERGAANGLINLALVAKRLGEYGRRNGCTGRA